jgi:hypothetical protein
MSYTDEENLEAYLGRPLTSAEVAFLPYILAGADKTINDRLGGSYGAVDSSAKYYDGGYKVLPIDPAYEITAVETVDSDVSNTVTETYVIGDDLELEPLNETTKTYLTKRWGYFPHGIGKIKVTGRFSLGVTPPDEIVYAATYIAANMLRLSVSSGVTEEQIEGYSRKFSLTYDILSDPEIDRILGKKGEILL